MILSWIRRTISKQQLTAVEMARRELERDIDQWTVDARSRIQQVADESRDRIRDVTEQSRQELRQTIAVAIENVDRAVDAQHRSMLNQQVERMLAALVDYAERAPMESVGSISAVTFFWVTYFIDLSANVESLRELADNPPGDVADIHARLAELTHATEHPVLMPRFPLVGLFQVHFRDTQDAIDATTEVRDRWS